MTADDKNPSPADLAKDAPKDAPKNDKPDAPIATTEPNLTDLTDLKPVNESTEPDGGWIAYVDADGKRQRIPRSEYKG